MLAPRKSLSISNMRPRRLISRRACGRSSTAPRSAISSRCLCLACLLPLSFKLMAIEYRVLGKTGLRVSTLGFGGSEVGYQAVAQKTVDKILNTALDAGIYVIDTAECYADGETLIGKAIAHRRAEFVLMTKCGHAPLGSASER